MKINFEFDICMYKFIDCMNFNLYVWGDVYD